jgi:hypothetical protein
MKHDHHLHEGAALANAARLVMERAGEQWTAMRASVFEALAGFDKPASAYDIAEAVSRREERRVAANSVYRILDLFVSANLAHRVESANAYVAQLRASDLWKRPIVTRIEKYRTFYPAEKYHQDFMEMMVVLHTPMI